MKRLLLCMLLMIPAIGCYSQAYIPMPADGGTWRYRSFNDIGTVAIDFVLFLNGTDTFANGNTYHKLMTRSYMQSGTSGFNPPVVAVTATSPDTYYGAVRESGRKYYILSGAGEKLMFDFNAAVGDSIPAYLSKKVVTGIDSVLLAGVYHKRYLTADTGYYVIEGVGSSRGLIPDLNDGGTDVLFFCFNYPPVTFSPVDTIPCTEIYQAGHDAGVDNMASNEDIAIYPNPVTTSLHIIVSSKYPMSLKIWSAMGQEIYCENLNGPANISTGTWPRGVYYIAVQQGNAMPAVRKFVIQ